MLEGKLNAAEYAKKYPEFEEEAKVFIIECMQRNLNSKPMKWKFGVEEYKQLSTKTREETSCGPSGLHMSHWKTALQSDDIMDVACNIDMGSIFTWVFSNSVECVIPQYAIENRKTICHKTKNYPNL